MLAVVALPAHLLEVVAHALDRSEDVIVVAQGEALQVIGANDAFGRLIGLPTPDAIGDGIPALLGLVPDDPARRDLLRAARAGEAIQTELHCTRGDGSRYWFGLHLMPSENRTYVVLGRDITARRQARARQEAVEGLLTAIFRHVDAAIAIVDADGRLLMTNPHFDRTLGFVPGSIGRQPAIEFVATDSREAVEAAREQQLRDGQPFTIFAAMLRNDATRIQVRLSSVILERPDLRRVRMITLTPAPRPLEQPRFAVTGQIRLAGLDEVKAVLGGRWDAVAERALQTAEHILQKHLDPHDTFSRTEDLGLLVCFADLTEHEASLRTAAIGREIRQRLVGLDQGAAGARVVSAAATVELPDSAADDALPLARVLEERLSARRTDIEATARRSLTAMLRRQTCELHRVQQRDGSIAAHYARFPPGVEARILAAAAALPREDAAAFDIDVLRLSVGVEQAHDSAAGGIRLPVLIDVAFEIFETRAHTERYIEGLHRIDARAREQIVLMLTDQPDGVTISRIRDCMLRLRPYCREIGFVLKKLEPPPPDLIGGVPMTFAIGCEAISRGQALTEEALFQFLPVLHARRGRLLVFNVGSVQVARELREIGVDQIALSPMSDA